LIKNPPVASLLKVKDWEKENDYTLPADFVEIVRINQGRRPMLSDIEVFRSTLLSSISGLFHFEKNPAGTTIPLTIQCNLYHL